LGIETGKIFDSAFSSSSHAGINSTASKARFVISYYLKYFICSHRLEFEVKIMDGVHLVKFQQQHMNIYKLI